MSLLFVNGRLYSGGSFQTADVFLSEDGGRVFEKGCCKAHPDEVIDVNNAFILPGLSDAHVHFREPGFLQKETIKTGSLAAARGGFTAVCTMPNLRPAPSNRDALEEELRAIRKDAGIHVLPFGSITRNQDGRSGLSDMERIAPYVAGFSDDGKGIQDGRLMRDAMETAHALGKPIAAHCEDEDLLGGSDIHEGKFSRADHHAGIHYESVWRQAERDIKLADETGCAYHVCHVSCRETVDIIRDAKKSGVDVTCETGPHYLTISDEDFFGIDPYEPGSGRFKMYPPICGPEDREALIRGIIDGTIDMIATDHAPHTREEKTRGLFKSVNGVIGLETSFPVMYTNFVEKGRTPGENMNTVEKDRDRAIFTDFDEKDRDRARFTDFVEKRRTPGESTNTVEKCRNQAVAAESDEKRRTSMYAADFDEKGRTSEGSTNFAEKCRARTVSAESVEKGLISMETLIRLMCDGAKKRFKLPDHPLRPGETVFAPDFTIIDVSVPYIIDPEKFLSKGRSTPFEGWKVKGRTLFTVASGKVVYRNPEI